MGSKNKISPFQWHRLQYQPALPPPLKNILSLRPFSMESFQYEEEIKSSLPHASKLSKVVFEESRQLSQAKPLRVGVVFSGGQAPGGNNVISGLYDALQNISSSSVLIGFLGGPSGLIEGRSKELGKETLEYYRNLGGFDLLGSDRTKLEAPTQLKVLKNAQDLGLDGLVIIGGDDSNTNAALLSEFFVAQNSQISVVGIPKTIDGDLKSQEIEASFGFDTATKVYSDIIGNLARDALSARKYYFFVKLMGRTASSIALECALQTHPNFTLVGEEILANGQTLNDIVSSLADLICERAKYSKDYGIILIPEGLLEFIPDCQQLIKELGTLSEMDTIENVSKNLSSTAQSCFQSLPDTIRRQLLLDRDPHGNLQVSKIETERLLIEMVQKELNVRKKNGHYTGKFSPQPIFCGYEGRSCAPSNFDANYCYALGHVGALLIQHGLTGYMAAVKGLSLPLASWQALGIPLLSMMGFEERKGKRKIVIRKALVDLQGPPFQTFKEQRASWALQDDYRYPGAIQYFGPPEVTDRITCTLALEHALVSTTNK